MVALNVHPKSSLMDDPLSIWITDLTPGEEVTLVAKLQEDQKKLLSSGCYVADSVGRVDVSRQPSLKGTYTGIESMGLLWSMSGRDRYNNRIRLMKQDVTTPYSMELLLYKGHFEAANLPLPSTDCLITSTTFERWYKDRSVSRVEVREGRIRGTLFLPSGPGPFPGVIDIFGSAGGVIEHRAALLASHGFVTLALGYFGFDDLPETFVNTDLHYFEEAINWLSSLPSVAENCVGMYSVSLGTSITMELSTYIPKIKACVCVGSPNFLCGTTIEYKDKVMMPDWIAYKSENVVHGPDGIVFGTAFRPDTASEESRHKIEKSNAHFLFIHGEADVNTPARCCEELVKCLQSHGKNNFTAVIYPGAGHLIEPPYSPYAYASYQRSMGVNIVWGGNARQHSYAQEDSWRKILQFFRCHLPCPQKIISRI